jgi:hypothetical protein
MQTSVDRRFNIADCVTMIIQTAIASHVHGGKTLEQAEKKSGKGWRIRLAHVLILIGVNVVAVALALLFTSNYAQIERVREEALRPTPMYKEIPEDRSVVYYIQAGSFFEYTQAHARAELIKSMGEPVEIREGEKKGYRIFTVLIGPTTSGRKVFHLKEELLLRGVETIKLRKQADGSLIAAG